MENTFQFTDDELSVINKALDFYARIGIGQFDRIKEHPTFDNIKRDRCRDENGEIDYTKLNRIDDLVDGMLLQPRNVLINSDGIPIYASLGINHELVDESCRIAFDILKNKIEK